MFCPACHVEYPADWKVCPKDTTSLLPSSRIGKYAIEGVLGIGGMGAVYRARNPDTNAAVALKVMNAEFAVIGEARERFKREAGVVSRLDTTHVCKVFDFGNAEDGTLFLVMELMKGHTLRDEIAPLPDAMDLARVQMVMNGALKGLAAAHQHGIVHRDLKPENVFVADTFDGEVPKLLDFGIARVASASEGNLTRTGTMMGTASYMAPEQVSGAVSQMGPWTDTYAMGAILYELLVGAPAFDGSSITEMLHRVVTGQVVPLASLRPGLPPAIYALVDRCLAVDPKQRPADAEALRLELLGAQLVPPLAPVPPPRKTRVDASPVAATIGRDQSTALTGPSAPPSAAPVASAPVAPKPVAATTEVVARAPAKRSPIPFIVLGVLAIGGGVTAIVVLKGGGKPAPTQAATPGSAPKPAEAVRPAADAGPPSAHPDMVLIPAGEYTIGEATPTSDDSLAVEKVKVAAFWIDKTEVTRGTLENALGTEIDTDTRDKTKADLPTTPARFVDNAAAEAACQAMGKRLPTEEEWEVAALTTPQDATKARLRRGTPHDLALPGQDCSAAGLCDMLGGVQEWTHDTWPNQPKNRVVRGGSFLTPPLDVRYATVHARQPIEAASINEDVGFRCVANAD